MATTVPTGSKLKACCTVRIDMNDGSVVDTGNAAAVAGVSDANKRLSKQERKRQSAGCTDVDCGLEKVAPQDVLEATMAEADMTPTQVQARLHEKGYCVRYADVDNAFARRRRHEKAAKRKAAATHVVESQGTPDDGARISLDALFAATAAAVSN